MEYHWRYRVAALGIAVLSEWGFASDFATKSPRQEVAAPSPILLERPPKAEDVIYCPYGKIYSVPAGQMAKCPN